LDTLDVHRSLVLCSWREQHQRVRFHFTPTYSPWLNPVETWLGLITRDCIWRGIYVSVPDWVYQIKTYVRLYSRNAQPFRWTYRSPRERIRIPSSETPHSSGRRGQNQP
jgi:hypothetical protein